MLKINSSVATKGKNFNFQAFVLTFHSIPPREISIKKTSEFFDEYMYIYSESGLQL